MISNGSYRDKPLTGAPTDAQNITAALTAAQFDITPASDVQSQNDLVNNVLKPFLNKVKEGDIVVIYYFGHGFSLGVDDFLVPTAESTVIDEADVYDHFLPERTVRYLASQRRPGIILLLLDACRVVTQFQNPGAAAPLVAQAVPGETDVSDYIVSFAAEYGASAYAPEQGAVSYYTDALAKD